MLCLVLVSLMIFNSTKSSWILICLELAVALFSYGNIFSNRSTFWFGIYFVVIQRKYFNQTLILTYVGNYSSTWNVYFWKRLRTLFRNFWVVILISFEICNSESISSMSVLLLWDSSAYVQACFLPKRFDKILDKFVI